MPKLALALWVLYGVCALFVRVAIHRRRTGESGLVRLTAPPLSLRWFGEVGITIAIVTGLAGMALDLTGTLGALDPLDTTGVHATGIALFALGLIVVVVAQSQMADSWRIGTDPDERTALVTGGVFRLVRNPIYTALVPTLLGLALLVPNVVALASVAIVIAAIELETRLIEEPHLKRVHGEAYDRYASHAGRFVPGIGRLG